MITEEQKRAVRILVTGMAPDERHAHIAQLRRNSGRSHADAALLQYAQLVAADVAARERRLAELECKVSALEASGVPASLPAALSPDLARGALALTAVGVGAWGVYKIIVLVVSAGLMPWIGGAVMLLFLAGALSEGKSNAPGPARRQSQTINVNVNINQQQ